MREKSEFINVKRTGKKSHRSCYAIRSSPFELHEYLLRLERFALIDLITSHPENLRPFHLPNQILPLIFPQFLAYNRITISGAVLWKNCQLQTPQGLTLFPHPPRLFQAQQARKKKELG